MSTGKINPLVNRLRRTCQLTEDELQMVSALPLHVVTYAADREIVKEGQRPQQCFIVLEGLACGYKQTSEGNRQIAAFHIAGDMPDLHSLQLDRIDTSFRTISSCTLGFVAHDVMHAICAKSYNIAAAFWRLTLIDGSIFREWEINLGQRLAPVAMAHLLCEQFTRMEAIGLTEGTSFDFPVTQEELGYALGLSTVHVNRTLQQVRKNGLINFEDGRVEIMDLPSFAAQADFDPSYLHLSPRS